jgi:hypothetical protein
MSYGAKLIIWGSITSPLSLLLVALAVDLSIFTRGGCAIPIIWMDVLQLRFQQGLHWHIGRSAATQQFVTVFMLNFVAWWWAALTKAVGTLDKANVLILLELELPFQAFALTVITTAGSSHSLHFSTQLLDLGLVMGFDPFHDVLDSIF